MQASLRSLHRFDCCHGLGGTGHNVVDYAVAQPFRAPGTLSLSSSYHGRRSELEVRTDGTASVHAKNDGKVKPTLSGLEIGSTAGSLLVATEPRLNERAEEIVLFVVSSKLEAVSGNVACSSDDIDIFIINDRIDPKYNIGFSR